METPTHHRAVALALVIAAAFALARTLGATDAPHDVPASSTTDSAAHDDATNDAETPTLLDPNTAPASALERLPGVGPMLARRIIAARESGPPFRSARDLQRVRGIGPRTLARIEPWLAFPDAGSGSARARDW